MKTLKIGVASYEQMKARTMAIARGELKPKTREPKVWFTSTESFAKVLSNKNRALLAMIRRRIRGLRETPVVSRADKPDETPPHWPCCASRRPAA